MDNLTVHQIHDQGININSREIFLHSYINCDTEEQGVEYRSAIILEKNLRILESINNKPILIHMHLPGGDWSDGLAIYDTIKSCVSKTIILAYAKVESSSSIILQSADTRILMPNCHVLLHYGSIYLDADHKAATSSLRWSENESQKMLDIFAAKCENSQIAKEKNWKKMMARKHIQSQLSNYSDWIMPASEAVYYGFADGILGSKNYPDIPSLTKIRRTRKKTENAD